MFKAPKNISVGIIGLGRFGMALAKRLCELGKEVLVLDENEFKIREMRNFTEFAFICDDLSKEALEDAGIQNCELVAVCIGQKIDVSILVTLNVVSLGIPKVIAKAVSYEQGCVLEKIGAEVVYPERDMALRLAKRIVSHNVLDFISHNSEIKISELTVPRILVNQTVKNCSIRPKYGLNIIALKHDNNIFTQIDPNYKFSEDDIIVVIGEKKSLQLFEQEYK